MNLASLGLIKFGVGGLGVGAGLIGLKKLSEAGSDEMERKHAGFAILVAVLLLVIFWLLVACSKASSFESGTGMRWPNPFRRKKDSTCPRNFSADGKKCIKNAYAPDTNPSSVCPPGYTLNMSGKCAKFWPDGASNHVNPMTCAQSTKYMVDWDEENTCREPCKDMFEFNQKRGQCTAKCPPGMKDFGTYCKSQTPVRNITRSDGKY